MPLKQAALDVEVDFVGHVLNNVVHTLCWQHSLLGLVNGQFIQLVKLGQGGLQGIGGIRKPSAGTIGPRSSKKVPLLFQQ